MDALPSIPKLFPRNIRGTCIHSIFSSEKDQLNADQAVVHAHTHAHTCLHLLPSPISSALASWTITSENKFSSPLSLTPPPLDAFGCQETNLILGGVLMLHYSQRGEKPYALQPASKNPGSFLKSLSETLQ